MNNILLLMIVLAAASSLTARMGETRTELVERLGKLMSQSVHVVHAQGRTIPLGPALFFQKDTWLIQCDMIDDRCARIRYNKTGDWTQEQVQALLTNNTQDLRWTESAKSTKMIRDWTRTDQATAKRKFTGEMVFTSPLYSTTKSKVEADAKARSTAKPEL